MLTAPMALATDTRVAVASALNRRAQRIA